MRTIRSRLNYANVMSSIAVFLLLGGGAAFAASKLAKNSVGTKQLKSSAVTTPKIKNAAVTGEKLAAGSVGSAQLQANSITGTNVRDGSLSAADLAPGTIPTPTPRTARLRSGETITGFMAIEEHATNGSEFFGTGAGFQLLPQNPIPETDRKLVTHGLVTQSCPGIGKAAAGYLCVYETNQSNAKEPNLYPEVGLRSEPATYGFQLQVQSETEGTVIYNVVWAYTEP